MAKPILMNKAKEMRRNGLSLREITHVLNVSLGSVSAWCRDIELTKEQTDVLQLRNHDPNYGKRAIYLKKVKNKKNRTIKYLLNKGYKTINKLNKREQYLTGLALYWAEGFKKDKQMGFSNMDPNMIVFIIHWLTRIIGFSEKDIKLRIIINEKYKNEFPAIEEYWHKVTKIPLDQFQKPTIIHNNLIKEYKGNNNYKGVLRIRVAKSLTKLREILGTFKGFSDAIGY